jgi:hypothetical protein
MPRRSLLALALAVAAGYGACSGSSGRNTRYPRRAPGCELSVHHGLPEVKVWDDIGIAQVDCYLDESEIACLGRLRTEACRMGGDILYNVPAKAARPIERGMIYRAQVAHTRPSNKQEEPMPDAGAGPVVPIPSAWTIPPPPPPPAVDAGGQ